MEFSGLIFQEAELNGVYSYLADWPLADSGSCGYNPVYTKDLGDGTVSTLLGSRTFGIGSASLWLLFRLDSNDISGQLQETYDLARNIKGSFAEAIQALAFSSLQQKCLFLVGILNGKDAVSAYTLEETLRHPSVSFTNYNSGLSGTLSVRCGLFVAMHSTFVAFIHSALFQCVPK